MRAEAVSWDDWKAENAPPMVEEDKWHVELGPGDVKIVSLEQLDDLFRLSIVDAETKVWQNGMGDWQPLRVIADLDDAPAPEPKRTHPKPPSPRSAPPPPRPHSVAPSPSVRPASVRPAPPAPRPQSVAQAPVFFEPIGLAATQPAFSAPIAVLPIASVRPLVVSTRPPVVQRGGGLGRFLVGLSLVAGVGISLYRNGIVGDAAQAMRQDALFARLESALGGPAFGTLRAVQQGSAARLALPLSSDLNASLAADSPLTKLTALAAPPPVVSLDSLSPEKPVAVPPKAEVAAAASPTPAQPPKPATRRGFEATQQAKAAPAKPAAVKKPAPASELTERERLNAAIGHSMLSAPTKSKSKSNASEYDPLNPKL